jgi:hypothetical protein
VGFVIPSSYTASMYFVIIHSLLFSFPFLSPLIPLKQSHYYKHVLCLHTYTQTHMHTRHVCICIYIYMYLSLGLSTTYDRPNLSYDTWEKVCDLCLSKIGLLHLEYNPFTWKQHNFILLYDWIMLHCVYLSAVGYLGFFHSLTIANGTAVNMVCKCLLYPDLYFFNF